LSEIGEWLSALGLSQYESVFREHDVDYDILIELTEADLKELGLSLGHRRRILRAINELRGQREGDRQGEGEDEAQTPWTALGPVAEDLYPDQTSGDPAAVAPSSEAAPDDQPQFAILVMELRNLVTLSRYVHHLHLSQVHDELREAWAEIRERWNGIHVMDEASKFVAYFGPSGAPPQSAIHAVCAAQEIRDRFRQLAEKISNVGDPPPRTFWNCGIGIDCGPFLAEAENGELRDLVAGGSSDAAQPSRSERMTRLKESITSVTAYARSLTEVANVDAIVVSARAQALLKDDFKLEPASASGARNAVYLLAAEEQVRPALAAPKEIEGPFFNPSSAKARSEARSEPRPQSPGTPSPRPTSPYGTPVPSSYASERIGVSSGGSIRKLEDEESRTGGWLSALAIFLGVIVVGLPILAFVAEVDFLVSLFEFLQGLIT